MRPDAASWIGLASIPGIGEGLIRSLIAAFGHPDRVFSATGAQIESVIGPLAASRFHSGPRAAQVESTLSSLALPGRDLLVITDPDYPLSLRNIADPPPLLYLHGVRELLSSTFFAIVGSRNASASGCEIASGFARSLSDGGFCIVAGLATGIDSCAHEGALSGKSSTVAVLGNGIDVCYPLSSHDLYLEISERGLLVTEFAPGKPPVGGNFPRRNRIISGLSVGTLVVEAGPRSGSLITARLALEQGRDVFAIPGSIHSPLSKGPNALIREGAKLVEKISDITEEYGFFGAMPPLRECDHPPVHDALLDAMGFDPVDIDTLCARTGYDGRKVSSMLLDLEIAGRIRRLMGGMYVRAH